MSADLRRIKIRNFPQANLGRRLLLAGARSTPDRIALEPPLITLRPFEHRANPGRENP